MKQTVKKNKGINIDMKWGGFILVILLLFLAYVIFLFTSLLSRKQIASYQVRNGSLAMQNVYTGVVLREEQIVECNDTGYIAYFAREGEHMGVGDLVYAVDETGNLKEMSSNTGDESSLEDQDLKELRSEIIDFSTGFTPGFFHSTYDFLYQLDGSLLRLANGNMIDSLTEIGGSYAADLIKLSKATTAGYVIYNTDGYESLSANAVTPDIFSEENYQKTQLSNYRLVEGGTPAYKLLTSENWSIVIPLDKERAEEMQKKSYVLVRFMKNQLELWGAIRCIPYDEEITYCELSFNTSVINFCTERFLEVELLESNETGLKVPISSIVHKEFFLVPKKFVLDETSDSTCILLRKTFLPDGSASSEEIEIEVYESDDDYLYVDDSQLSVGDYLIRIMDQSEYPISLTGELTGVYNINKGYADFRRIIILYQNEEFAIVKPNTSYGLSEFDYIALDAANLSDDSFIFEQTNTLQ